MGNGNRSDRRSSTVVEPSVLCAADFSRLINREISRADRNGAGLSLVVVDTGRARREGPERDAVAFQVATRVRVVDSVGWMDGERFGIVLPSTSYENARMVIERVLGKVGFSAPHLPFRIYAYPWHSLPVRESHAHSQFSNDFISSFPREFCIAMPLGKRIFDVGASLIGILILWPFFLLVGAYIKIVSPGPVFYTQQRVGHGGELFTFLKFRTMKVGNNEAFHRDHIVKRLRMNEPLEKLDDQGDPRIIPGGRMIRRACIDELPQLVNVLKGEMSLVGPRPCLSYEAAELLRWHERRFEVVPGLTGLWQVSGKNKLSLLEMVRLDIAYAENMSPLLDLKIIVRTIPAIIDMVGESIKRKLSAKK